MPYTRSLLVLAPLGLATVIMLATPGDSVQANHGSVRGEVDIVAIDMDITTSDTVNGGAAGGNTATAVGDIEVCKDIATVGGTLTFDLIIDEVDPSDEIKGFSGAILYDAALVQVTAVNNLMLLASNGDTDPLDFSDTLPDTDGRLSILLSDFSGNYEDGEGILSRIELTGVAAGVSDLRIVAFGVIDHAGGVIPIATFGTARVAVGQPCPDTDGDGFTDDLDYCPDTATVWLVPPGDDDCDGWTTANENFIGTDPNLACGIDAWPPDFTNDGIVRIFDVVLLAPPVFFSSAPGPPYQARFDLMPDGTIDIFDVIAMAPPIYFATCTP